MKEKFDFSKFDFSKLDKKTWTYIGIGAAALVLVIVIIIAAVLGSKPASTQGSSETQGTQSSTAGGSDGTDEESSIDKGSDSATESDTSVGTETEPTENNTQTTESGDATSPSDTTEPSQNTSPSESTSQSQSSDSQSPTESENPADEPTESEETEGSSADNPLSVYPSVETDADGNYYITLPEIKAGETLYLSAYRIGGKKIVIDDSNARIVYDKKTYKGKDGVEIADIIADKEIPLQIKNNGKTAKTYTIRIETIEGTYDAPKVLTKMDGTNNSVSLAANAGEYYYTYTAEQTGTIMFTVVSSTNNADINITVTNIGSSGNKTIQDSISENSEGTVWQKTLEIEVEQGDVLRIAVSSEVNEDWEQPASDVKWNGNYK